MEPTTAVSSGDAAQAMRHVLEASTTEPAKVAELAMKVMDKIDPRHRERHNPHPTGEQEWTRDWVLRNISGLLPDEAVNKLISAHNAALAAERELVQWCEAHVPTKDEPITCCPCCEAVYVKEQLDAAVDALKMVRWHPRLKDAPIALEIIDAALVNIKEWK